MKRLTEESKQIEKLAEELANEAIEKAKNAKPLPVVKQPDPVARSRLQKAPPVVQVSPLEAAYMLMDAAKEYSEAKENRPKYIEYKKQYLEKLKTIKAESPSIWEKVQTVGAKFTKRITPALFIDREERKASAERAIAKWDKAIRRAKAIIDDHVKQSQHAEYNTNPIYRQLIQAAMAESPDARRKTTPDKPEQVKAYQPSSIELETALAPPE
jgi:hypothetical protein